MKKSLTEEIYPTSIIGKQIVYNKMLNHYKKIYNVKPRIDTNLKVKTHFMCRSSAFHCNLEAYSHLLPTPPSRLKIHYPPHERKLNRCHEKIFTEECTFRPAILDTPIQSKLKVLNEVYHPPRRRPPSTIPMFKKEYKPGSTSDISHADPKKNQNSEDSTNTEEDISEGITVPKTSDFNPAQTKKREKNHLCIPLLQDITNEVFGMGANSNEALKKVLETHLLTDECTLDQETIDKEFENSQNVSKEQNYNCGCDLVNFERSDTAFSKLTENEVLEALESLNLKPELRADLIIALDLNLFDQSEGNESLDLDGVSDGASYRSRKNDGLCQGTNLIDKGISEHLSNQNCEMKRNQEQKNKSSVEFSSHSITRKIRGESASESPHYSHSSEEFVRSNSLESIANLE